MWKPKFALSISVKLGKIGNPKVLRGPGYLLNHTRISAKLHAKQLLTGYKYKIDESKREQRRSYSEFSYKRLQQVSLGRKSCQ